MSTKFKRLSLIVIGALLVFSLAACGSNGKNNASSGGSSNGKVTLTLWEILVR